MQEGQTTLHIIETPVSCRICIILATLLQTIAWSGVTAASVPPTAWFGGGVGTNTQAPTMLATDREGVVTQGGGSLQA
jgi:hypothetical protein